MSNQQQFCPECGGKIIYEQGSDAGVCSSCGEKYFVEKRWLKPNKYGKSKKKEIYTVMPFTTDIGWKPSKMETEYRLHHKKRDEKAPRDRFSKKDKQYRKPGRKRREDIE